MFIINRVCHHQPFNPFKKYIYSCNKVPSFSNPRGSFISLPVRVPRASWLRMRDSTLSTRQWSRHRQMFSMTRPHLHASLCNKMPVYHQRHHGMHCLPSSNVSNGFCKPCHCVSVGPFKTVLLQQNSSISSLLVVMLTFKSTSSRIQTSLVSILSTAVLTHSYTEDLSRFELNPVHQLVCALLSLLPCQC